MRLTHLAAIGAALLALPAQAQDQPHQQQARQILEKLVSFRSAAGKGQNVAIADYVTQTLKAGGVPEADIARIEVGETPGLVVRIPGRDPKQAPVLFSAHMDVVDARPEDWTRDPFKLIEEDGTFFGRGVADNKTGVTSLISTILRLKAEKVTPERTLVFAFVNDEEVEMLTTREIAKHPWVKNARFAVNTDAGGGILTPDGKPLLYLVQGAEKTYATYRVTVANQGGHSSRPRPDNAIYDLANFLDRLEASPFPAQSSPLTLEYLGAMGRVVSGEQGKALRDFAANPADPQAAEKLRSIAEYVGVTRTTCVPTLLEAGHAENALPQKAVATINCRIFPGVPAEQVQQKLQSIAGPNIKVESTQPVFDSPATPMVPEVTEAIKRSIHKTHPGLAISPYQESGATDGIWYRRAGIPTVASSGAFFVPGTLFEHGLNERLPVKAFYSAIEHFHDLAVDLGK